MDRFTCFLIIVVLMVKDTSAIFPALRLRSILSAGVPETSVTPLLSRFHSLSMRTTAQLLACLLLSAHGENSIFAKIENLGLLVIDDLSTPVLATYPGGYEEDNRSKNNRKEFVDSVSNRRNNLLKDIANKLASLSVTKNITVCSLELS